MRDRPPRDGLERFCRRLWRLAILVHPRELRGRHGAEMVDAFVERCRGAFARGGVLGLSRVWLHELRDLAIVALRERFAARRPRERPPLSIPRTGRRRSAEMLTHLWYDFRHAARSLAKRPGFTGLAILILTLGIGANTAIFSVINGVLLRPLPYPDPHELVWVWPQKTFNKEIVATFDSQARSFSAVAGLSGWAYSLTGAGEPVKVFAVAATSRYFGLLGAHAARGRLFSAEEYEPGGDAVVVLSHQLWQSRFGGDPAVLGRTIELDSEPHTVIGVMPERYRPLYRDVEMWVPMPIDPTDEADYRSSFYIEPLARLAPGVTAAEARAEVRQIAARLRDSYPKLISKEQVETATVDSYRERIVGPVRPALLALLGAVGFVLLIACANVTNLLLVRASARRREMAIKSALGAGRGRIARQLLCESTLLSAAGGLLGLAVTAWTLAVARGALGGVVPRADEIVIDLRVLGAVLVLALGSALVFGLVPALRASGGDLRTTLGEGTKASSGLRRQRLNHALVAVEVAASVVLLVGAGLMLRSLWRLQGVDPGFRAEGVLSLRLLPPEARYPEGPQKVEYYRQVMERLAAVPGVADTGAIQILPMTSSQWRYPYVAEDHPVAEGDPLPFAGFRVVTPGYFETLEIPLVRGRLFTAADRADSVPVGLVNQALARELWPGEDPIGKEIRHFGAKGPAFTVIGVVSDVRQHELGREAREEMYRPYAQWPLASMSVAVRSAGDPMRLASLVREAVWSVDSEVPIAEMTPLAAVVSATAAPSRFYTSLIAAFALLALVLGTVGLYGVISYSVIQRTLEIGIRMALGARRGDVVREVLGRGLLVASLGLAVGLAAAWGLSRYLASLLYEVSATDAATFLAAAVVIAASAALGTYLPARRASAVDPIAALKYE